jgi:hypothetical protein
MRTLFAYTRTMPGHRLYRERIKNKNAGYFLDYACSFDTQGRSELSEEFEHTPTSFFDFGDIQTKSGTLKCSVTYKSKYTIKVRISFQELIRIINNIIENTH